MFLRKLFNIGNKGRWLILELIIVFIGVYLAFLFQGYGEQRKEERERQRIFAALKTELEYFRVTMDGRATFTRNRYNEFKAVFDSGDYNNFSDWRFLEPQYAYQVIEYAINHQNTDIIDFDIFQSLTILFSTIKRLEHAERMTMEMAHRYKPIHQNMPRTDPLYLALRTENYQNFSRFLVFFRDRANNQRLIARESEACLELINSSMDQQRRKEIERDLIFQRIERDDTLEEVIKEAKEVFPDFSDKEITEIFNERKH